jgi:hypothetical protein
MKRPILAFVAGLVLWFVVLWLLNRGLRVFVSGYAAAEPNMSFTLGMLAARLTIAALASLVAGAVAAWLAPANARVPTLLGAALLAAFIPVHAQRWWLFPFWYHLVFLGTLLPLVMLGGWLTGARGIARTPAGSARP